MGETERPAETLYLAEEGRGVTFQDLYFELGEIYDAASGLELLLSELAQDLTDDGYEPARYLMARLTVKRALELIDGLAPRADRRGRNFRVQAGAVVFQEDSGRA